MKSSKVEAVSSDTPTILKVPSPSAGIALLGTALFFGEVLI